MQSERFTQKSQQALQAAQGIALRYGHPETDGEHLLLAMLEAEDGLAVRLFERMQVPCGPFRKRLEEELAKRPRVTGVPAEASNV